jgi:hypothetical protein
MRAMLLVLLLLGIPAVAGINYMRNAPLDQELATRPYAGITDTDLATLLGAYGDQVKRSRAHVSDEPGANAYSDPARFGQYGDKVQAFEKFQRTNESWKHARGELFGEQTTLKDLQHEKSIRDRGLNKPWPRIWRRISTF